VVRAVRRPPDTADCYANRVHRVAETLVGRRLDGELALELVGYERTGRLGPSGGGRKAGRRPESTLEPAPTEAGGIEVVADVPAGQGDRVTGSAVVVVRLGVVDQRVPSGAVRNGVTVGVGFVDHLVYAAGCTGRQVDRTKC